MADEFNINEWLLDEYIAKREALQDLMRRHEEIVNTLADICRRNDRLQTAGDRLVTLIHEYPGLNPEFDILQQCIDDAIQKWTEANT